MRSVTATDALTDAAMLSIMVIWYSRIAGLTPRAGLRSTLRDIRGVHLHLSTDPGIAARVAINSTRAAPVSRYGNIVWGYDAESGFTLRVRRASRVLASYCGAHYSDIIPLVSTLTTTAARRSVPLASARSTMGR